MDYEAPDSRASSTAQDRSRWRLVVLTAGVLLGPTPAAGGGFELEVEAGAVFVSRSDVRVPSSGGTLLSLDDDLSLSGEPVFRVRLGYRIGERHLLSLLYAPLTLAADGAVRRDVQFDGGTYPAGTPIQALYRFDSYRLTYRYSIVRRAELDVAAGFTAKIRDAGVALVGTDARRNTNTGFVPLLNVHVEWRPGGGRFGILFDADALAAPQGRAEDVLLAATWAAAEQTNLSLGYRMLEGGADSDEVFTFVWFHYVVAGLRQIF